MCIVIHHRRNTLEEIKSTPGHFGVEIDLRSYGSKLIVQHEPFQDGLLFEEWINEYRHKTLILNVKEEGLEQEILKTLSQHQVTDYFFLDQSFPFMIRTARSGETRCAVRVSEYESADTALAVADLLDWIWLDCFNGVSVTRELAAKLNESKLKICLVSPELQGRLGLDEIERLKDAITRYQLRVDAVCTKDPQLWI